MSEISVLRQQVEDLEDLIRSHLGADWATPIGSSPHPSLPARYREIHGPTKESVDGSNAMTFIVDYDASVLVLHQAKLTIRIKPVRSNVSAAAGDSGGGSTSGSGGGSSPTSAGGGSHRHQVFGAAAFNLIYSTSVPSPLSGGSLSAAEYDSHTHVIPGGVGETWGGVYLKDAGGSNVYVALPGIDFSDGDLYTFDTASNHTHSVTISSHTHTVPDHTHPVSLTYGIFEGPTPTDPDVSLSINGVDVTSALGGPWNADVTLDITQYLRENSGDPLRQDNEIVLTADELCDLEVVCKSFVSASTPLAVNVQAL